MVHLGTVRVTCNYWINEPPPLYSIWRIGIKIEIVSPGRQVKLSPDRTLRWRAWASSTEHEAGCWCLLWDCHSHWRVFTSFQGSFWGRSGKLSSSDQNFSSFIFALVMACEFKSCYSRVPNKRIDTLIFPSRYAYFGKFQHLLEPFWRWYRRQNGSNTSFNTY